MPYKRTRSKSLTYSDSLNKTSSLKLDRHLRLGDIMLVIKKNYK